MAALTWLGPILELAVLTGLIVRRRIGALWTLPLLLLALIASATTVGLCAGCNTWRFWIVKELVHTALLFALGLELSQRGFESPAARRDARRWAGFVVVALLFLLAVDWYELPAIDILPRLTASVAWLYTGLSLIMLRHGGRIETLPDTILSTFAAYLMIYAALWSRAAESRHVAALVNPPLQIAVLGALLYAAWARPRANARGDVNAVTLDRIPPTDGAGALRLTASPGILP